MTAVLDQYTTEYIAEKHAPAIVGRAQSVMTKHTMAFTLPAIGAAAAATSKVYLRRLPPGLVWFFPLESRIRWSAGGASLVFDIGYGAYTKHDLTPVVASANIFDDDVAATSAGVAYMGSDYTDTTGGYEIFNSQSGVDLVMTMAGLDTPLTFFASGYLVYASLT